MFALATALLLMAKVGMSIRQNCPLVVIVAMSEFGGVICTGYGDMASESGFLVQVSKNEFSN